MSNLFGHINAGTLHLKISWENDNIMISKSLKITSLTDESRDINIPRHSKHNKTQLNTLSKAGERLLAGSMVDVVISGHQQQIEIHISQCSEAYK